MLIVAIDRVKKITFLVPRNCLHGLIEQVHRLGVVHVEDTAVRLRERTSELSREMLVAREAEDLIHKLDVILSTIRLYQKKKSGIVAQFAPVPLQVRERELEAALELGIDPVFEECESIYARHRELERQIEEARAESAELRLFVELDLDLEALRRLRVCAGRLVRFSAASWRAFLEDAEADEHLAWEIMREQGKSLLVLVVYVQKRREEAAQVLRKYDAQEVPLPRLDKSASDRLAELEADIAALEHEREEQRERVLKIAEQEKAFTILLGYWESERAKVQARNSCLLSRRIAALAGYVRVKDMDRLERMLAREFPGVSLVVEDPQLGDEVPVSLTVPRLLAPGRFLVNMFGLPNYFSFDPSAFLLVCFLVFFGMCFGDVVYGAALIVVCAVMMRRYASHEHVRNFFALFLYGGITTGVFGALTGNAAGDLWKAEYLGAENPLLKLIHLVQIEKLSDAISLLLVALTVGVLSQFYGIVLRIYRELRWGRTLNALFDGGLWLLYLPGLLMLASTVFFPMPAAVSRTMTRVGGVVFGAGALGLVLTQGRHEKTLLAKAITGLVSLYGILGSYGGVSFIVDMVSYSRLLALGMTTAVVATSFNLIAGLMKGVSGVGIFLFAGVVVVGHTFNFLISILGAFVHSARLIFLEFFGRYYEGGGVKFRPLGFDSERVQMLKE